MNFNRALFSLFLTASLAPSSARAEMSSPTPIATPMATATPTPTPTPVTTIRFPDYYQGGLPAAHYLVPGVPIRVPIRVEQMGTVTGTVSLSVTLPNGLSLTNSGIPSGWTGPATNGTVSKFTGSGLSDGEVYNFILYVTPTKNGITAIVSATMTKSGGGMLASKNSTLIVVKLNPSILSEGAFDTASVHAKLTVMGGGIQANMPTGFGVFQSNEETMPSFPITFTRNTAVPYDATAQIAKGDMNIATMYGTVASDANNIYYLTAALANNATDFAFAFSNDNSGFPRMTMTGGNLIFKLYGPGNVLKGTFEPVNPLSLIGGASMTDNGIGATPFHYFDASSFISSGSSWILYNTNVWYSFIAKPNSGLTSWNFIKTQLHLDFAPPVRGISPVVSGLCNPDEGNCN